MASEVAHAVFISYSANDTLVAEVVCSTLESRGIKCWMAPRDVVPGKHWGEAIIDAINETQVTLVILSSSSNTSPQVLREVERAANRGIPIVTFRIEGVSLAKSLEYYLSSYHWLDATRRPFETYLGQLADTVERLLSPPEVLRAEGPRRGAAPGAVPVPAERRQHPFWFWLGLLLLVGGLGMFIGLLMPFIASDGRDVPGEIVFFVTLPFALLGILSIWLSRRRVRHSWFWPGSVMFAYGLASVPGWLIQWINYSSFSADELPIMIGAFSVPFIIVGAFFLWKGWPRSGVKHPRGEVSAFLITMCTAH